MSFQITKGMDNQQVNTVTHPGPGRPGPQKRNLSGARKQQANLLYPTLACPGVPSFPGFPGEDAVDDYRLKGGWIETKEGEDPATVRVTPAQLAQITPRPLTQTSRDHTTEEYNEEQLMANQRSIDLLNGSGFPNDSLLRPDNQ